MDKKEIYRRVGCTEQLFGVREMRLKGGKTEGMNAVEMYNAVGMRLLVLPDRGMDIASLNLDGVNISFLSKTGLTASFFFQENGSQGFFRSFYAGFLTTCGLTYMGAADEEDGKELGLHGLISNIPANEVYAGVDWEGDLPRIVVSGTVKQAEVFGEHIVLKRKIILEAEKNQLTIEDKIENRGLNAVPFMLLYHMNYGYPFVSPHCRINLPSQEVKPRDDEARKYLGEWNRFGEPLDDAEEQVFFHKLREDTDGKVQYSIVNTELKKAVQVSYSSEQLPWLTQWKCPRSGEYVLGLEPGNCHVMGRRTAREDGSLRYLAPLEEKRFVLNIEGFSGDSEIKECL